MELLLEFTSGRITGEGMDGVGPFVIDGKYSIETSECHWDKTYVGRHTVGYRGFRDKGKGIWGTWSLDNDQYKGGFQIVPVDEGVPLPALEEDKDLELEPYLNETKPLVVEKSVTS